MPRIIMMSFVTAALVGGQFLLIPQLEIFRATAKTQLVQPKTSSISGVIINQRLTLFSTPPSYTAQKKSASETLITIKREACFGSCPVYSAEIHNDGTVVYVGEENVKVKGEQRHKISGDRVKELIMAFERIKYFSLKDKYEVDENGR